MMKREDEERISPEKAKKLLEEDGIDVSLEEAAVIADFLFQLAEIVIDIHISKQKKS